MKKLGVSNEQIINNLKSVGAISCCFEDECGIFCEFDCGYDLELPADFIPHNKDGEVQGFKLLPLKQVMDLIRSEEFKPVSALGMLDFLVRHGYVTAESDPQFCTIMELMHITHDFD